MKYTIQEVIVLHTLVCSYAPLYLSIYSIKTTTDAGFIYMRQAIYMFNHKFFITQSFIYLF